MKSNFLRLITFLIIILLPNISCSNQKNIQDPVVAGQFYPGGASSLKMMVEGMIAQAPQKTLDGHILGLIAPHAGYQYSGKIAATAFKQLEGKKYSRVVVVAPSHHVPIDGAALSTKDVYRTPIGDIPIDKDSVQKLLKNSSWAKDDQRAYEKEHSLEVELPFLQTVLKNFKLVPLVIGTFDKNVLNSIAEDLNKTFQSDDTLFIASSDLSHFQPYDEAVKRDKKTISLICDKPDEEYYNAVTKEDAQLCGAAPVYIMKELAKKRGATLKLLEYANSGDTAGNKSRVVGYAAIAVVMPNPFGDKQKQELLKLARTTVEAYVKGAKLPPLPPDPVLKKDGAAFVTLKKHGILRGCIGQIIAQGPLNKTVQEMAIAAAANDPRFPPVKSDELKDITVEISVLTAPEDLPDPLSVRVGTDGLIIEKGFARGVLLPQVPTEQGWNKEQYLEGICQKAGLSKDAWKDAKLRRFQAIVFGE